MQEMLKSTDIFTDLNHSTQNIGKIQVKQSSHAADTNYMNMRTEHFKRC